VRRVIIASLIATAALATSGAPLGAAPRLATTATGTGQYFIGGGSLTDAGIVVLPNPIRRSATTSWSYSAGMVFSAGTGCTTSIGTCYASSGTITLADGTSSLTATFTGTDDAMAEFRWTAKVTGGTGQWRRARGTIRVAGVRDGSDTQGSTSSWDLSRVTL